LDEIFPLLKYDARAYSVTPEERESLSRSMTSALASALIVLLLGSIAFSAWERSRPLERDGSFVTHRHQRTSVATPAAFVWPANKVSFQPTPYRASVTDRTRFNQERLDAEHRQREQTARDQAALAERMRAETEQRTREAQKAAGTDYHVPLDENYYIPMPGAGVWVKVHDDDVTSFDIWINGARYRDVPKEKGITHSRTDEKFVYNNGSASLYYVWEIAGEINHCMLRVRQN
ncbi:MAG: hypothetical protein ACR2MW_08140, partial [Chthoniobacterales bacterium]